MNCDCIQKVNAQLKDKNLKLVGYSLMMPEFKSRFYISTAWIDRDKAPKGKKNNPTQMLVTFCPFCGVRYSTDEDSEVKNEDSQPSANEGSLHPSFQ